MHSEKKNSILPETYLIVVDHPRQGAQLLATHPMPSNSDIFSEPMSILFINFYKMAFKKSG